MKLTPELLTTAVGCTYERARLFAGYLDAACAHFQINSQARMAAFLAQVGHESGSLRYVREIADGSVYEGRTDLGNVQPGDGKRYKGRGLIQVTGRDNYRQTTQRMRELGAPDFIEQPEALEEIRWAAWSAADWWHARGCSGLADVGEFIAIGRLINRGNAASTKPANGENDRIARWHRARMALATDAPPAPETPAAADPGQPASQSDYMPPGEAPDWVPPQPKGKPMAPFIAAALSAVLGAAPELIDMFKGDSKSAARNSEAAKVVVNVAKEAIGAANEQDLIERLADPAAAATVRQAVRDRMVEIMEAGGGGIGGARSFLVQAGAGPQSDRMWAILTIVTYAALGFLLLANLIASAAWGVAIWRDQNIESATQFLAQVITADIGATMTALGFWLGSSFGSRQKDERTAP